MIFITCKRYHVQKGRAFLCFFLRPAGCNADMMAGALVAGLDCEVETTGEGWQSHKAEKPRSLTPRNTTQALTFGLRLQFYVLGFLSLENKIDPVWVKC